MAKSDLTGKERKQLHDLESSIEDKSTQWLAAYDQERAAKGVGVRVTNGTEASVLYAELVALRTKRNDLLAQLRAAGKNI